MCGLQVQDLQKLTQVFFLIDSNFVYTAPHSLICIREAGFDLATMGTSAALML